MGFGRVDKIIKKSKIRISVLFIKFRKKNNKGLISYLVKIIMIHFMNIFYIKVIFSIRKQLKIIYFH